MNFLCRFALLSVLLVPFAMGCSDSSANRVLDGEVVKDPSLDPGQDNTVTGSDPSAPEAKPTP